MINSFEVKIYFPKIHLMISWEKNRMCDSQDNDLRRESLYLKDQTGF